MSGYPSYVIMMSLKDLANHFRDWNKQVFKKDQNRAIDISKQIESIEAKEEVGDLNDTSLYLPENRATKHILIRITEMATTM